MCSIEEGIEMKRSSLQLAAKYMLPVILLTSMIPLHAYSQVKAEHPRIWLTDERLAVLRDRVARNTYNANQLTNWCNNHMDDGLSGYVDGRANQIQNVANFAALYQATGNEIYAQEVAQIIEYVFDNPYSDYGHTLDSWVSYDNYYTSRSLVPSVALALDWCYDYMSQALRDRIVAQLDSWARRLIDAQPWAWHDPSNNYYYGHTWALTTAGYAIYGHNSNAREYIDLAHSRIIEGIKYTRGEEVAWEHLGNRTGRAKGGLWNEGTGYGIVNIRLLCAAVLALQSAEGIEHPEFVFPNEAITAYIYATHPDGEHTYSEGDAAAGGIGEPTRSALMIAQALADDNAKRYGQHWIESYTVPCIWDFKQFQEFIWYDDQLEPLDYSGLLPDYYYLEGTQTLFWRDGWGADATWMAFKIGVLNTDHAHNGLGNFLIFKEGFLATDKAVELTQTTLHHDRDHNCLYIPQTSGSYAGGPLYWGASVVEHMQSTGSFLYFAGDMSDPYLSQPDYRNNTIEHKEREFFLIKDEKVLAIMDRGTSYNQDKIFQVYLHNQASPSRDYHVSSNGNSQLIIKTGYPQNTTTTLTVDDLPLLQATTDGHADTKTFLHLLKVTDPGVELQSSYVTASEGAFAAAAFRGDQLDRDYLIAFSNDPEGDTPAVNTFSLSFAYFTMTVIGHVMNLNPNSTYYVSTTAENSIVTFTISTDPIGDGEVCTTNDDGVLFFIGYPGEEPQPPPPLTGVKIK